MDISEGFSGSDDHRTIVKGKRNKRTRPSSSSASSSGGGAESLTSYSSTTSTRMEEDEDMANCLILLARGGHAPQEPTATCGGGNVYECKACGKSFPSFQALGGHRASHKKPTPDTEIIIGPPRAAAPPISESKSCHGGTGDPNKAKTHECWVCGSEFGSGQALGGHMRRHRSAPTTSFGDNGAKLKNVPGFDLNLPAPPEDERFLQLPAEQPQHIGFAAALVDCHY